MNKPCEDQLKLIKQAVKYVDDYDAIKGEIEGCSTALGHVEYEWTNILERENRERPPSFVPKEETREGVRDNYVKWKKEKQKFERKMSELYSKMLELKEEAEETDNSIWEVIDRIYATRLDCPKSVGSAHRNHAQKLEVFK